MSDTAIAEPGADWVARRKKSSAEWRKKNVEKQREYSRQWRARNLDRERARERNSRRERYAADPEKAREYARQRYAANPEKRAEVDRRHRTANRLYHMLRSAKRGAVKRGLVFDITEDDLALPTHCPVLGIRINYDQRGSPAADSPSIDRVDNAKGYVKGNVLVISYRANTLKSNASAEELRAVLAYVELLS